MTFWEKVFNVIVTVIQYVQQFFRGGDYYIQKVELLYTREGDACVSDVTVDYKHYGGAKGVLKDTSKDVTDVCFKIVYLYKLKPYVYLTRNPDHAFPPKKGAPAFRIPVKEAFTLDENDVAMHNVTRDIKMYEGPHTDFHGEDHLLYDMDFSKLRLVNIMGTVVETDDRISHQSLWLQGKT